MPKPQTSPPSRRKEKTGVDRLYKYTGARKVSFYYQYPDGSSETLGTASLGDRQAIMEAERVAKRKALDIQQGQIIAGSVADAIDRFKTDVAPTHYRDQSKDGLDVRQGAYNNLTAFFGAMAPAALKMIHGYQFLDARAKVGAPIKANKEMALMSTMCNYWVRWGLIEVNPFIGMMLNKADSEVRAISRRQVVRFYLWSQTQDNQFKVLGCAALFAYLTGYRAAEVRPFHTSGLSEDGVRVTGAKRKRGEAQVIKVREWSRKLRMVVARARRSHKVERLYLFANRHGKPYSRSGWGSVWQDAMLAWVRSFDPAVEPKDLVKHPAYFSLQDVRPAGITKKMEKRDSDVYDFAANGTRQTTDTHYDRRKIKRASATE